MSKKLVVDPRTEEFGVEELFAIGQGSVMVLYHKGQSWVYQGRKKIEPPFTVTISKDGNGFHVVQSSRGHKVRMSPTASNLCAMVNRGVRREDGYTLCRYQD